MVDELVPLPPDGQILVYSDGGRRLQVRLDGQTVWLSQMGISELFQTTKQNVSLHLQNIFEEGELEPAATVKHYLTVQTEGRRQVRRAIDHYNLDAILAVGYRVRSHIGTAFRRWATARLSELLVKGFTMDDDRLKATIKGGRNRMARGIGTREEGCRVSGAGCQVKSREGRVARDFRASRASDGPGGLIRSRGIRPFGRHKAGRSLRGADGIDRRDGV